MQIWSKQPDRLLGSFVPSFSGNAAAVPLRAAGHNFLSTVVTDICHVCRTDYTMNVCYTQSYGDNIQPARFGLRVRLRDHRSRSRSRLDGGQTWRPYSPA